MFVVSVMSHEGDEPEMVGPFPTDEWAERWIQRLGKNFYRCEVLPMLSPRLLDVRRKGDMTVFDPEHGIDIREDETAK